MSGQVSSVVIRLNFIWVTWGHTTFRLADVSLSDNGGGYRKEMMLVQTDPRHLR